MAPANGPFFGFRPAAFGFFRGLARHNDPLWFKPRKAVYDSEVLTPLRALLLALSERFAGSAFRSSAIPAAASFASTATCASRRTSSSTRRTRARC